MRGPAQGMLRRSKPARHPGLEPGPAFFFTEAMDSDWQPCVYILAKASHSTLYTGVTSNLPARIWQHRECRPARHSKFRIPSTSLPFSGPPLASASLGGRSS